MKSRLSLRAFSIYLLCIALPIIVLLACDASERIEQSRKNYHQSKEQAMDHVAQALNTQFAALEHTANEIYLSSWYRKSISQSDVYQKEFHIVRKMEISNDLMYKVSLLPFVKDILILDMLQDIMICKHGWFGSIQKYSDVYCTLDLSNLMQQLKSSDLFTPVQSLDDRYYILSYPDSNHASTRRIAFLLEKTEIQNWLNVQQTGQFTTVSLVWKEEQNEQTHIRALNRPAVRLQFTYPDENEIFAKEGTRYILGNLALALVASAVLAIIFTILFTRPLEQLLHTFAHDGSKNQRAAIAGLSSRFQQISEQNESLRQKLGTFVNEMRGEILLRMMMNNGDFELDIGYMDHLFPWLVANEPFFMMLTKSVLSNEEGCCLEIPMPTEDKCYLFWQPDDQRAETLRITLCNQANPTACTAVHRGICSLHACYDQMLRQLHNWQQPIALADLTTFLSHLQSGNEEQCIQVLTLYRQDQAVDAARYLQHLLIHWMQEKAIPDDPSLMTDFDDWKVIYQRIRIICSYKAYNAGEAESPLISSVNRVMREYLSLSDLSLKYLADQFGTSVGALSRLYKRETGRNFSTVLLEMRLSRAKTLLLESTQSIASIAQDCGYENYLSFKRAFLRKEGISPREYRTIHMNDAGEQDDIAK